MNIVCEIKNQYMSREYIHTRTHTTHSIHLHIMYNYSIYFIYVNIHTYVDHKNCSTKYLTSSHLYIIYLDPPRVSDYQISAHRSVFGVFFVHKFHTLGGFRYLYLVSIPGLTVSTPCRAILSATPGPSRQWDLNSRLWLKGHEISVEIYFINKSRVDYCSNGRFLDLQCTFGQ